MSEPTPEFSYILSPARLSPSGAVEELEAKPAERAALAKRFELTDMPLLKASLSIQPAPQQTVIVTGHIDAEIVQSCVITLEPLTTKLDFDIHVIFVPGEAHAEGAGSPYADEHEEEMEIYSHGKIDLGEMVAQQVGVRVDPYPRKPDAALPQTEFGAKAEEINPFALLAAKVKDKDKK